MRCFPTFPAQGLFRLTTAPEKMDGRFATQHNTAKQESITSNRVKQHPVRYRIAAGLYPSFSFILRILLS